MMKRHHAVAGKPRHLSGWRRGKPDGRDKMLAVSWLAALRQPAKASVRGQPGLKVEDQADIGSCVCNSSTTAVEFALKKDGVDAQLSRLYPYAKVRQYEGTPLSEDSGAQIRDVMKVLAKLGSPPEALWPYDLSKWQVSPPASLDAEAAKHRLLFYYRCPTLSSIKASIAQGWPVVGGFSVPENMMSDECAKTGVVKYPGPMEGFEGGHAVLFTGYDNAAGQLEFMNSWSEEWGSKGYGYLPFAFVTKGLADDFWSARRAQV